MKLLDKFLTENDAETISKKVLDSIKDKIKQEIAEEFYNEMNSYLSDHYTKIEAEICDGLIKEITEMFIRNPEEYKFRDLRKKIWEENKAEIIPLLTEEATKKSVERIILKYSDIGFYYSWKWKDGIAKMIIENWHLFKDDERINSCLGYEIDRLNHYISNLKKEYGIDQDLN